MNEIRPTVWLTDKFHVLVTAPPTHAGVLFQEDRLLPFPVWLAQQKTPQQPNIW